MIRFAFPRTLALLSLAALLSLQTVVAAGFDDRPRLREFKYPNWFKPSFLDLRADLKEARKNGKLGVAVYFGQDNCAYCEALLTVNFTRQSDIATYTQRYFDVIGIDIWGSLPVTTLDGRKLSERAFADEEKTNFTPTLIFYNTWGQEIFRMRGYYPPYRFRAMLDYLVGGYYQQENFRAYLERAEPPMIFDEDELNPNALFSPPPYLLDRSSIKAERPLAVFFEQSKCHACDLLHSGPLDDSHLHQELQKMDVVQLDMWRDTPVLTPDGQQLTARQWAEQLGLFYTPTLIFFDEEGNEVIRIDSTVGLYRLSKVVRYVLTKAYRDYPIFQRWHEEQILRPPH